MSEIITNKKDLRKGIDSLIDLYFSQPKVLYSHLFSSYHQFVEEMIPYSLEEETNYFYDNVTNDAIYLYGFKFEDTKILPPVRERDNEIIFPQMARKNFLNYFANINTKVTQFQEKVNLHTGEITRRNIGDPEEMVVASIPVMVKSKYCATSLKPETSKYECKYDPGGYFIVGGQEKVVVSIEKMIDNKILVFSKSDSSFPKGKMYTSQINSRKHDWSENLQIIAIRNNKDDSLIITTSQLVEIPIMVLLRALGIENDRELIARITNNLDDIPMVNLLRNSLENSVDDNGNLIKTREEAINFLMTKMKAGRRISQSDEQVAQAQKKLLLEKIITKDLLPHLGADIPGKASFICLMVKKILLVMLGRKQEDDRDAFENKRVETPGVLLGQLFRQNFNKMLKEIGKLFRRKNNSDETPINMVSQITPTTIEQGIKSGLATGIWGVSKTKAGAAQSLSRLTWLQTISYLRRIKSPNMDTSTSKITSIRQINNVQAFFVCNVETPEGQPIGLAKSLSMMATITPRLESQTELINKLIEEHPKMYHPFAVNPEDINNMIKIFHNGSWKGVLDIKEGYSFFENLKKMRRNSKINKFVTITLDYFEKDLYIYTEAGRLIRPLLKVDDNEIKLTKTIVADIKKHLTGDKKSSGWNQILLKYPDLVDYEDIESSRHLMFAMDMQMLLENKANSLRDINTKEEIIKPNRYGKFRYVNYTHSEFHPSMMLGTIVSTVPFINHNPSPRGIIFFSQAKQAIGIYSTAYKDRMDISNILYHPQVPLVGTKASKYNRFDDIPSGENIIVAIMSYKGYNVEDSIMINQTSLDRGLFRADSLRKYSSKIEKNPSSSQDDIFMKPDRNKVTGMTRGNYEKLNEKGYIPEETPVTSNDILIGKVSPIQPTSDNKVYKDKSELFKSNVDGVVDRVHKDIFNNDGYEMISMRVRMERPPIIGDKFSTKHGQKGTVGITLPQRDMPFTSEGMTPDLIFNPHGMPTRMTMGQLAETLASKAAANIGELFDGTPFSDYDVTEIPKVLKELGMDEYGTEEMYCGMTGRKMKARIFIGPMFYLRLKHMVLDKVHSRSMGPRQAITRQPMEGRSKDGGLKIGEMEKDAMVAHGIGQFLKERMMENSDITTIMVCDKCGTFATKVMDKEYYVCNNCNNHTDFSNVAMPYAFKLMVQELTAVNILPRIRAEKIDL
uniref:putative DNA-directed RNA polymerase subunit Rpb2 n=1 Tax=Cafeteria roenbergensis virus (strain BV-PW1) TaxID=693272 RepID=UPI0001E7AE94|nr:putative DNA-directed RNA polymerase subunit Rpb2 [Cafeteria roenbergensis virus BV-PW1]